MVRADPLHRSVRSGPAIDEPTYVSSGVSSSATSNAEPANANRKRRKRCTPPAHPGPCTHLSLVGALQRKLQRQVDGGGHWDSRRGGPRSLPSHGEVLEGEGTDVRPHEAGPLCQQVVAGQPTGGHRDTLHTCTQ
jgi:hypothetical protein